MKQWLKEEPEYVSLFSEEEEQDTTLATEQHVSTIKLSRCIVHGSVYHDENLFTEECKFE